LALELHCVRYTWKGCKKGRGGGLKGFVVYDEEYKKFENYVLIF
jgi:hypothetical protein